MNAGKLDILWSPVQEDLFLTYSTSIKLYRCQNFPPVENIEGQNVIKLSDETYALYQPASSSENQFIKCIAWYPGKDIENLIAVGQVNGRVGLRNFGQKGNDDIIGRDFMPKHTRQCCYLSWNPVECNLLAEGLDRYRNDCAIAIWDIHGKTSYDSLERQRISSCDSSAISKPHYEIGSGESTSSLCWFQSDPKTFIAGIGNRHLHMYDLRDVNRPRLVAQTKNIHGVCVDQISGNRIASYSETHISIWDPRNFDRPLFTLQELRPVIKINWCPARMGSLAVLCKDSSVVKLYDVRHTVVASDELEPPVLERNVQPFGQTAISSFSWHPSHENRLLAVTPTETIKDLRIFERISLAWNPVLHLTWSCGKKSVSCHPESNELTEFYEDDISIRMRRRALKGYGTHPHLPQNKEAIQYEPELFGFWRWLTYIRMLYEEMKNRPVLQGQLKINAGMRYIGIKGLIVQDGLDGPQSEEIELTWQGLDGNALSRKHTTAYRSPSRNLALQLCGWSSNHTDFFNQLLENLQERGEHEKAAALALFKLKMKRAIEILSSASENQGVLEENASLNSVAMALAGFTEDKNTLWQKTCTMLRTQLKNPYLRAMFAFLAGDRENYTEVLNEPGMALEDRVAIALTYLPDNKLSEYLKNLCEDLKNRGDLDGLLLTGMTIDGVDLLEKYIDRTGDVQNAALAAVYTFPNEVAKDKRIRTWIECYCDLLDRWRLWHERAKFDIIRYGHDTTTRVPSQVFASCNFCGKSIALNTTIAARSRQMASHSLSPHKPKLTSCPSCRKALPRCSLCLTHLGTASSSMSSCYPLKEKVEDKKVASISEWFTWCQNCRHGGHTTHIMQWFHEHTECPVTGCSCKCMKIDPVGRVSKDVSLQLEKIKV